MLHLKYETPSEGSVTLPSYNVCAETKWKTLYSFAVAVNRRFAGSLSSSVKARAIVSCEQCAVKKKWS